MFNLEEKLNLYIQKVDEVQSKSDAGVDDFWYLDNLGNEIKNYLLTTFNACPGSVLFFLISGMDDLTLLDDKFYVLRHIKTVTNELTRHYVNQVKICQASNDINGLISAYEMLFKLTKNYYFKMEIGILYYMNLSNPDKALEIFQEIEPQMKYNPVFWLNFSDAYVAKSDYFNQVLCLQKMINMEKAKQNNA